MDECKDKRNDRLGQVITGMYKNGRLEAGEGGPRGATVIAESQNSDVE